MFDSSVHINVLQRRGIFIEGAVQGVGFRPFVYRLAREMGLCGFVRNSPQGVNIQVQGPARQLDEFLSRLKDQCPQQAVIVDVQSSELPIQDSHAFEILESQTACDPVAVILPDLATCPQCLTEIFDPRNRRYLYPFTNCTYCGPRYSILENLPYDRPNTSMKDFVMCPLCRHEYGSPDDRRFHAQPNACPECGPVLQLLDHQGESLARGHDALMRAVIAVGEGKIVAVKGLGGFQLIVDACCPSAVKRLRERKHRQEKPLAMMFPHLQNVKDHCLMSAEEERIYLSAQAPIVLFQKRPRPLKGLAIADEVALDNPRWGIMRPYTPLHHILMRGIATPIVATSANLAQEPMCIDNEDALKRLGGIADVFLLHDRPIVRPVDDSLGIMMAGAFSLFRRARGYAPLPIGVKDSASTVLALGAQMKNTVALKVRDKIYLSQHIGDLESPEAVAAFEQAVTSLRSLYPQPVTRLAVDLHPDYFSSRFADRQTAKPVDVQHHHAHIAACMAEHHLTGPVLGLAWDGTGLGTDHTIWGSEFLIATPADFTRAAHLRPFRIPGGDSSIRQPKRTALGLLVELFGEDRSRYDDLLPMKGFTEQEFDMVQQMILKGFRSPSTSSMGRLFDGVSSLIGLCQVANFEGQAAMKMEYALDDQNVDGAYPWQVTKHHGASLTGAQGAQYLLDWRPMLHAILDDVRSYQKVSVISKKFHLTLIAMAVDVIRRVGIKQVVLSGGCFQNKFLLETMIQRLRQEGFEPYWPVQVPANDGGIALGQAVVAAARLDKEGEKPLCV